MAALWHALVLPYKDMQMKPYCRIPNEAS